MLPMSNIVAAFCFTLLGAAHPLRPYELGAHAEALMPNDDPFYTAPQNISDYTPGVIIRSRLPPGPLALFAGKINILDSRQILFRTNGATGEPLASVTTIIIPHNADYKKLLSYQVEIDSPYSGCFPSITLQQRMANVTSISSQYGMLWVMSVLEKGWVVSVPDHDGPNAAFGAGILAGQVTLDSLRAALQSRPITGLLPDAKVALWGYSGGALATEWALETQEQYAPQLRITAAAIGGVPANASSAIFETINKNIGAGLAFGAAMGLANAYPEFDAFLKKHLLANATAIYDVTGQCTIPTVVEFAYKNFWDYIDIGDSLLNDPYLQKIFALNKMGNLGVVPKVPTYMYHAINDELLPFQDTLDLYDKYCAAGANIEFVREGFGEHIVVALTGAAGALRYLMARMDGSAATKGCRSQTVVTSALDPTNISVLGDAVFSIVAALLGTPLGPTAWLAAAGK
ncbi:hypothetical protein NLG97_g5520 [Lecanicillium saksenae]|uniref:Uncharacterized protein n=1 Tax=Lecanicillium saksenae TaxID=468837 RepID=A0ACC1QVF1_9HYPO|nr:hypothetical protein NLG97_g5520 [Lecanicillium saksenae]